jgi:cytochrome b6-f complex iron-sulfur subunit
VAKQQRRVFLKVIAVGPLLGCAGAATGESSGMGGTTPTGGGGGAGSAGAATSGAGGTFSSGGSFASGGTFTNSGGSFVSGGQFGTPGGGQASGGSVSSGSSNPGLVVANLAMVPVGAFIVAGGLYFLGRDAGGLYAMSMQCTHKGCTVGMNGTQLLCPCHQARFDFDGNVLAGPATAPLPRYAVYVDEAGNISVDKYTLVDAGTRTPV